MATLVYFPVRGFGEIVRLVLTGCGIEFNEEHVKTRDEFLKICTYLPFGQLPLLRIDGKDLVQSNTIVRHLARRNEYCGASDEEMTRIDTYFDASRDFAMHFYPSGFRFSTDKVKVMTNGAVHKYLPSFEKILKNNGNNGYLVGSSLTLADFGLLEVLLYMLDYYEGDVLDGFPAIQRFLQTMSIEPYYDKYVNEIRTPPHTPERVNQVKKVLNMC